MNYSISSLIWYLGVLIVSVSFASKAEKAKTRKKEISFLLFSFLSLILFCGFRFFVGNDYEGYYLGFGYCASAGSNVMAWEPGYYLVNTLFFNSEIGYFYALFLCTIITYTCLFFSVQRVGNYKYSVFCIVTLGFLITANNLVRQGVAMSICIFSLKYVIEKKPLLFLFCVLLASSFHLSALVFSFAYFFNRFTIKKQIWIILLFLVLVMQISGFAGYAYRIIMSYVPYYGEIYLYKDNYHTEQRIGLSIIFNYIIAFSYILLADHRKNNLYSNLYLTGILLLGLFFGFSMFERIAFYYYFVLILAYPSVLKLKKISIGIIMLIVFYFSLQSLFGLEKHGAVPYRTIINENLKYPNYDRDEQEAF